MLTRKEAQRRLAKVKPTVLDRMIGVFSPEAELKRYKSRQMLALTGGYSGGKRNRKQLQNWRTTQGADADSDIVYDLDILRDRSRDLSRNNALGRGIVNTKTTSVIGAGLKLQSEIDYQYLGLSRESAEQWQRQAEREFNLWAMRPCNVECTSNFYETQDIIYRSRLESGDVFVLRRYKPKPFSPYELKVHIIEADRVCNKDRAPDTASMVQGIEKDADGAPVKLHIASQHPGAMIDYKAVTWSVVDYWDDKTGLPNVLHITKRQRPHQTRGVPDLAPVIEAIKQLGDYKDNELTASVVTSLLTVFIKSEGGDQVMQPVGGTVTDENIQLGSGAVVGLAEDEDIVTVDPTRPNMAFDGFVMAVTREIGVAIELPYEVLIKHFTASYSAAQAALLEAWRYFKTEREGLVNSYCRPVYEMVMYEAIARGRIQAPGFFDDPAIRAAYLGSRWVGQAKGHVNEMVSANAAEKRIELEISTRKEEASELGRDYERTHEQRAHEERLALEDGTRMDRQPVGEVRTDD